MKLLYIDLFCGAGGTSTGYETDDGRKFPMFALEFFKEIDWEQRRYEIAKEAIRGVALNADRFTRIEIETTVNNALELADLLISELKKGGQNV